MYSLWLVPYEGHAFTKAIQELISETVPSNFASSTEKHNFRPHVTVGSGIDLSRLDDKFSHSPQAWLDSLPLEQYKPEIHEVILELDRIQAGEPFFRKLTVSLTKNEGLVQLARECKQAALPETQDGTTARQWAMDEYEPHLSLMYSDIPRDEVQKKIPLVELQIGFGLGSLFDCCGGTLCLGGDMVLVDTDTSINEWVPVARRKAPWAMWRASRNLL